MVDSSFWLHVALSVFCGFLFGIERQIKGKPVGIRTSILICLGTATFSHMGLTLGDHQDPTRVLGQIITGVGFLGAGVIMNLKGTIIGVTSASVVWLLAGVGAAIGYNQYGVAVRTTFVSVIILMGVEYLETRFPRIFRRGVHAKTKAESTRIF